MNANEINKLKQFFLTTLVNYVHGGAEICFREKSIKFEEKGAILTDKITHNGLSVGDLCLLADSPYFNCDNYELNDVKEYHKEVLMKAPRIILAFFELEAAMPRVKRRIVVRKFFCATGKVRVERASWENQLWGWVPEPPTIVIGKIPIIVDVCQNDGKKYVKLYQADLLKKCEEDDSAETQKK